MAERRIYTFKSEGLDYDVQAKLRTLLGFGASGATGAVARSYQSGRHRDVILEYAAIDRLIVQEKMRIRRAVEDLDVLRAIARDLRDVVRSGDPPGGPADEHPHQRPET